MTQIIINKDKFYNLNKKSQIYKIKLGKKNFYYIII